MLQKIREVAAKLMTPRKSKAGRVVRVPRCVAFAACASALLIAGCGMDLTGSYYQSRTQLQDRSIPSDDNYYAEEDTPDAEGFLRSQGFWPDESRQGRGGADVYCRGDNCIEVERGGKVVLGTGKQFRKYRYLTPDGEIREGVLGYEPPGTVRGGQTGRWRFAPEGLNK
jgi:hypothetical protein